MSFNVKLMSKVQNESSKRQAKENQKKKLRRNIKLSMENKSGIQSTINKE